MIAHSLQLPESQPHLTGILIAVFAASAPSALSGNKPAVSMPKIIQRYSSVRLGNNEVASFFFNITNTKSLSGTNLVSLASAIEHSNTERRHIDN